MSKYFSVNGYWKDDGSEFDGYIVKEYDDYTEEEDDDIFFFGLDEDELEDAVRLGEDTVHDFVITSFEEIELT